MLSSSSSICQNAAGVIRPVAWECDHDDRLLGGESAADRRRALRGIRGDRLAATRNAAVPVHPLLLSELLETVAGGCARNIEAEKAARGVSQLVRAAVALGAFRVLVRAADPRVRPSDVVDRHAGPDGRWQAR